jgi:HAD superfamily hydrolase (TIGR01509 family)
MPPPTGVAITTVLLDVDGTLVDSNDAHAKAWVTAFAESGISVSFGDVRRSIGMGGDKLMPRVSDLTEDSPEGQRISARRHELFLSEYLADVQPFRNADRLVAALTDRGFTVVAASSAKQDELRPLLERAGVQRLLDDQTSSDDADRSKPDPDIIQAALQRTNALPEHAIMIGDTPYDIEAARRAGVATIAFRCGGWSDADLTGAVAIYDGPWDLVARLDDSPLGRRHEA